jgi:LuxR family transcriptional regulator, maltose regulon positive regulatory protein
MTARKSRERVLPGKLSAPRLGRAFDRARLFGALDQWASTPAIWIAAAPGAGKSTLVATWLQHHQRPTLWMQVDAGDSDPATFLQSLDALLSSAATKSIALPAFHADDLSDLAGWLRRRLRLFLPHLPPTWAMVFDNHQELPNDAPMQLALAQAISELPRGVQWIFISRVKPPAPYARQLAQQQLTILDAESLRFDMDETIALARLHGHPDSTAQRLAAAQGWAGGMTLMLLGTPQAVGVPGIDARQHLFDYFAGEVLDGMPQDDREALCAIAFMPSVTGAMASALTGYDGAPAMLERLAAMSLFTDRREGAPTGYVFHALFSEFLRKRYAQTHTTRALQALRGRAAELLAAIGQTDAAMEHLIEAERWGDAASLLQRAAAHYVSEGRTQALLQQIDRLPALPDNALAYWRGYCLLDVDAARALPDLIRAHTMSAALADADAELDAAAAVAAALVTLGRVKELDPWVAVLTTHAQRAAVAQGEEREMRWVPGMLAAIVYRAPWHPLAEGLAHRAERLLHAELAPAQRLLLGSLAFHLLWRGHVDRLERIVLRIDGLCAQQLAAPATMMRWWGVGILVKTLLGQYTSARQDAERALALVAQEPSVAAQRAGMALLAMIIALASRDVASARKYLEEAAATLHPDDAVNRATLEHQRGMLALLEDDRATAIRLMRASVVSARAGGFPMREHIALIANALAAARSDAHAEAEQLIADVFAHPFHGICRWHHWVAGIVAAYAARRRGDLPQALTYLRGALATARDCGFRYGPMLYCAGDMMSQLSALALEHAIEPDVARDLVLRNDLPAPAEAGAAWPWAVRIYALGPLRVERADGPVPASRKESRRLLELLRLLVAHGEDAVSMDAIADGLWPDSDGDAARNALENALHRLRKWLGGDDRILMRQGTLWLNPNRCWTDVRALEQHLVQFETSTVSKMPTLATALRALYPAPLLPEETLAAIAARRQALHGRVDRALQKAGDQLRASGASVQIVQAARESLPNL